jgi:hypothetical protein
VHSPDGSESSGRNPIKSEVIYSPSRISPDKRWRSLCRLLPAPAATGILPTLSLRILPQMPGPVPRQVPRSAFTCFFLCVIGLPRVGIESASCFVPRTRLFAPCFSRLQAFLLCSCFVTSARTEYASRLIQVIDGVRTLTPLDPVAVGMPIARHPPHRPVLALLAHTVPTLDAWRRSAR